MKKTEIIDSQLTLQILRDQEIEKYKKELELKKGESRLQWEERTSLYRMRHEKELRKIDVKMTKSNHKFKLSVFNRDAKLPGKDKRDRYEKNKRIINYIYKRPFHFFQNSLIILAWAELKYRLSKEDILFLMYVYAEERSMVQEELLYKIKLFGVKNYRRKLSTLLRNGYFSKYHKTSFPQDIDKETDLYVLSPKAVHFIKGLHEIMVGTKSLDKFKGLRKDHKHIDDYFDKIKQEIIEYKTGVINPEK